MTHYTKGTPSQDWTLITINLRGILSLRRDRDPEVYCLKTGVVAVETRVGPMVHPEAHTHTRLVLIPKLDPRSELDRATEICATALFIEAGHGVELQKQIFAPVRQRVSVADPGPKLTIRRGGQSVDKLKRSIRMERLAAQIDLLADRAFLEHRVADRDTCVRLSLTLRQTSIIGTMIGPHVDEPGDKPDHRKGAVRYEC